MKKVTLAVAAALSMAWAVNAQMSSEYQQMNEWLFQSMLNGVVGTDPEYGDIKSQWSMFGDKIYKEIKAALPPIDPAITAAQQNLRDQYTAEAEQKAIALGYTSFDDLYMKTYKGSQIPNSAVEEFYMWYKTRGGEVYAQSNALAKAYNDELNSRFQAVFIEAVKKLQENSSTMK